MVRGLDIFAGHFTDFKDCYALIGGSACFLILTDVGLSPRATKDLDIVLCIEQFNADFAKAIWDFLVKGQYKSWQSDDGKKRYFRFIEPGDNDYPFMLELFSRIPDALNLPKDSLYTPITIDDEISSLSAILLDDDYYRLVKDGKSELNNTSIVKAEYLIPLKIKAWIDLTDRKNQGAQVNSDDIAKHRGDAFRLSAVINRNEIINLEASVQQDMIEGIRRLNENPNLNLNAFGLGRTTVPEVTERLTRIYGLGA